MAAVTSPGASPSLRDRPSVPPPRNYTRFLQTADPRQNLEEGSLFFIIAKDACTNKKHVCAFIADGEQDVPVGFTDDLPPLAEFLQAEEKKEDLVMLSIGVPDPSQYLLAEGEDDYHADVEVDFLQWLLRRGWETEEAVVAFSQAADNGVANYADLFVYLMTTELMTNKTVSRGLKTPSAATATSIHWKKAAKAVLAQVAEQTIVTYPVFWFDDGILIQYEMPNIGEEYPEPETESKMKKVSELFDMAENLVSEYEKLYYTVYPERRPERETALARLAASAAAPPTAVPYFSPPRTAAAAAAATSATSYSPPRTAAASRRLFGTEPASSPYSPSPFHADEDYIDEDMAAAIAASLATEDETRYGSPPVSRGRGLSGISPSEAREQLSRTRTTGFSRR